MTLSSKEGDKGVTWFLLFFLRTKKFIPPPQGEKEADKIILPKSLSQRSLFEKSLLNQGLFPAEAQKLPFSILLPVEAKGESGEVESDRFALRALTLLGLSGKKDPKGHWERRLFVGGREVTLWPKVGSSSRKRGNQSHIEVKRAQGIAPSSPISIGR